MSVKDSPLPRTEMDALLLGRLDELTVNESNSTRGRGILSIIISIIVLLLISSMIVAAIVIINPDIANFASKHQKPREAITLEEALLGELSAKDFSSQWLPANNDANRPESTGYDNDQLLYEDMKSLYIVTLPSKLQQYNNNNSSQALNSQPQPSIPSQTNNLLNTFRPDVSVLVSNTSLLSSVEYQGYKLSPSKRYLLIWTAKKKQFRYSFTAKYFLYDIASDLISLISTKPSEQLDKPATGRFFDRQPQSHNHYDNLDTASLYLYDPPTYTNEDDFVRFQSVDWYSAKSTQNPNENIDSLILIQNNDIYTLNNVAELSGSAANVDAQSNLYPPSRPIRLTYTGKAGEIFNGIPDWLYEEEILSDATAFQVSPSADYLAYLSFNDSQVNSMPYSLYGDRVIPRIQRIKYPKAGQPNPQVSVHIIDRLCTISSQTDPAAFKSIQLNLPSRLAKQQHYINRMSWLTNEKLSLIWSNRNQNESFIIICYKANVTKSSLSTPQWQCEENLHIRAENGWLDVSEDLYPLDDDHYLAILPKFEGTEVGNFKHIAKVSLSKPNTFVYLTSGRKEVISINGIDARSSLVYYTSTVVDEPGQRQMFVLSLNTSIAKQLSQREGDVGIDSLKIEPTTESVCVTCSHHPESCLYNHIKLSPSTNYYVFQCDGPDVPRTELRATYHPKFQASGLSVASGINQMYATKGVPAKPYLSGNGHDSIDRAGEPAVAGKYSRDNSLLWTIEDNSELRKKLEHEKAVPLIVRLKVPIQNTNYLANVLLLLPPPMGPTTTFRATSSDAAAQIRQNSGTSSRPRRDLNGLHSKEPIANVATEKKRENVFAQLDLDSIKEYASQLPNGQQYPMVVDVYGGPGSQRVDYRFNVYFGHYLASNRRTVYAMIDGRGSGYQGTKRLYELYHRLGTVEIQDQIDVASYLTKILPFVDSTKVAIWGWSYGGYASAMALAQSNSRALEAIQAHIKSLKGQSDLFATTSYPHEPSSNEAIAERTKFPVPPTPSPGATIPSFRGVFECAASVAPVTNWIYYDTAYTEKYMSSPWSNELYDENVSRDHLMSRNVSKYASGAQTPMLAHDFIQANKWTHLNRSALNSINNHLRPPPSQLLELIAKSALTAPPVANSTEEHVISNFIYRNPSSPIINELNERYRKASLLEHIGKIDRKRFLLIHGTADDNVHFQQSIMLMKQLIRKNILFETRLYPDQDHNIANKADKLHLGSTLSNFFAECFDMAY